jgi:orotidine-5'-phosphate decarboxylase
MKGTVFLVPGYGAQGAGASDIVPYFNKDGKGAIVHPARGVIFAHKNEGGDFGEAARKAALKMKEDISVALKSI